MRRGVNASLTRRVGISTHEVHMNRRLWLTSLPLLLLSTPAWANPNGASEFHFLAKPSAVAPAADYGRVAQAYLIDHAVELGLEGIDLELTEVLSLGKELRGATVRFEQRYQGLPVIGGQVAVRIGAQGAISTVVIDVTPGLRTQTIPLLDEIDARASAAGHVGTPPAVASAELAILPDEHGGELVWRVQVPTNDGGYELDVDASTGSVVVERALGMDALGRVWPISKVNTPATQDVELVSLDPSTPQVLTGFNGNLQVVNYVSGDIQMGNLVVEQTVQPNSGDDFLYDPPADPTDPSDAFAQVGIFHHLSRGEAIYREDLGVDLSGPSWKLTAVANMQSDGNPLDNAFFSQQGIQGDFAAPNLIGIGQGTTFDFSEDSDVFIHEFTHYVSHNAIGYNQGQGYANEYGLHAWGGAIDEGVSDYFACTENGDAILGEGSLALLGGARDLADTSKHCHDDAVGEVHADGEVIGSFAWTIREQLGRQIADQLVWGAMTLLTADSSLGDFATGFRQTAADLVQSGDLQQSDLDYIDTQIEARGLHECDTEVPLRRGEVRTTSTLGLDLLGQFFGASCDQLQGFGVTLQSLFHYVVTPEPGDTGIRITADVSADGPGALSYRIYARAGQHVTFASGGAVPLPAVQDYDFESAAFTGAQGELVIGPDEGFDPNQTYHVVVVHQNCPLATVALDIEPYAGGTTTGAGGAGGGTGAGVGGGATNNPVDPEDPQVVDSGCGCRVTGLRAGAHNGWAGFGLLALVGLGRARRRRH